jgi:hypothetical protein
MSRMMRIVQRVIGAGSAVAPAPGPCRAWTGSVGVRVLAGLASTGLAVAARASAHGLRCSWFQGWSSWPSSGRRGMRQTARGVGDTTPSRRSHTRPIRGASVRRVRRAWSIGVPSRPQLFEGYSVWSVCGAPLGRSTPRRKVPHFQWPLPFDAPRLALADRCSGALASIATA